MPSLEVDWSNKPTSDGYGLSVFDFNSSDPLIREYATPSNLLPKAGACTSSIQCPVGLTSGCLSTATAAGATLSGDYQLLPGVLHSDTADIAGYLALVPEPET